MPSPRSAPSLLWDVFCRVVDNFGDIGVAWRLANDLTQRDQRVRLWVDDASALAWMAPGALGGALGGPPAGATPVAVGDWAAADAVDRPGDAVVETFGCGVPDGFVAAMARSTPPPVWIDLEHLSAEPYVERSHGLPSPRPSGPGAGLTTWFWYPGFMVRTGGLIREIDMETRQRRFDAPAWLAAHGLERRPGERIVSVYCYESAPLVPLLDRLATAPTLVLLTAGVAAAQAVESLQVERRTSALRAVRLLPLAQTDYDHLLWAADLNIVRGEDSFVRAQWAGRPFLWQAYPQPDGAHLAKLEAFLDRFGADATVARLFRAWNSNDPTRLDDAAWPDADRWRAHCLAWRTRLRAIPDLTARLIDFVRAER